MLLKLYRHICGTHMSFGRAETENQSLTNGSSLFIGFVKHVGSDTGLESDFRNHTQLEQTLDFVEHV